MKKLTLLLVLLLCSPCFASIWYIRVPQESAADLMSRLDSSSAYRPYSYVIHPYVSTETTVLIPINDEDSVQAVLTPEEWASRLATMPAEFIRPPPLNP